MLSLWGFQQKVFNCNLLKNSSITFARVTAYHSGHTEVPRGIAHNPTRNRMRESRDFEFEFTLCSFSTFLRIPRPAVAVVHRNAQKWVALPSLGSGGWD